MTRQAVAKHLAALRRAELVRSSRQGREIVYELEPGALSGAASWIATVGGEWDERLRAPRAAVRLAAARAPGAWARCSCAPCAACPPDPEPEAAIRSDSRPRRTSWRRRKRGSLSRTVRRGAGPEREGPRRGQLHEPPRSAAAHPLPAGGLAEQAALDGERVAVDDAHRHGARGPGSAGRPGVRLTRVRDPKVGRGVAPPAPGAAGAAGAWRSTAPMSEPSAALGTSGKFDGRTSPRWSRVSPNAAPASIAGLFWAGAMVGVGPPLLPSGPSRGSAVRAVAGDRPAVEHAARAHQVALADRGVGGAEVRGGGDEGRAVGHERVVAGALAEDGVAQGGLSGARGGGVVGEVVDRGALGVGGVGSGGVGREGRPDGREGAAQVEDRAAKALAGVGRPVRRPALRGVVRQRGVPEGEGALHVEHGPTEARATAAPGRALLRSAAAEPGLAHRSDRPVAATAATETARAAARDAPAATASEATTAAGGPGTLRGASAAARAAAAARSWARCRRGRRRRRCRRPGSRCRSRCRRLRCRHPR